MVPEALYSILLLYKIWGYQNKFNSAKSLGVYYWCVKIPQRSCLESGLKYITFYVQQHIAHFAMCHNPPQVHKPLGAPPFVQLVYCALPYCKSFFMETSTVLLSGADRIATYILTHLNADTSFLQWRSICRHIWHNAYTFICYYVCMCVHIHIWH